MRRERKHSWRAEDEFWWLPREISPTEVFCKLAHTDPPLEASGPPRIQFGPNGSESEESIEAVDVSEIPKWWARWAGINVHRSLTVFLDAQGRDSPFGPFLVDVDGPEEEPADVRLEDARQVTIKVASWFRDRFQLEQREVRCHFSGWKGFHVEVRPQALSARGKTIDDFRPFYEEIRLRLLQYLLDRRTNITNVVSSKGTVIDPLHSAKRLANSINCWQEHGTLRTARRLPLTPEDLELLDIRELCNRA